METLYSAQAVCKVCSDQPNQYRLKAFEGLGSNSWTARFPLSITIMFKGALNSTYIKS